jgi:hypothetical protein
MGKPNILAIWYFICLGTCHPYILHLDMFNLLVEDVRKELRNLWKRLAIGIVVDPNRRVSSEN